jgi:hypothetical protein
MSCGSAGPAEAGARRAARCRVTLCLDDVVLTVVSGNEVRQHSAFGRWVSVSLRVAPALLGPGQG